MPPVGIAADAREHLAEDQEPERRLDRPRDQLGRIVPQLADLELGDRRTSCRRTPDSAARDAGSADALSGAAGA